MIETPDNAKVGFTNESVEDGLDKIVARIPSNWGKYIAVEPGWYPLIVELDQKMAEICPNYVLYQVKSKYGGLRYYFELPDLTCCEQTWTQYNQWKKDNPQTTDIEQERYMQNLFDLHENTVEHKSAAKKQQDDYKKMQALVETYEQLAAKTCEQTGKPGILMVKGGWYETLDPQIGAEQGFVPAG